MDLKYFALCFAGGSLYFLGIRTGIISGKSTIIVRPNNKYDSSHHPRTHKYITNYDGVDYYTADIPKINRGFLYDSVRWDESSTTISIIPIKFRYSIEFTQLKK